MEGDASSGLFGARTAAVLSALYASFAAAWIVLSDRLLSYLVSDPQRLTAWQTYKGWLFVAVTALLLYAALRTRREGERGQAAPAGGITRLALRYEVAFVLVALVVPLAALVVIHLAQATRQAEEFAHARLRTVVADVREDIAAMMRDSERRMARLASRELVRALDPKRCDPALADFRDLRPEYADLEVRDANARLVCGDPSRAGQMPASVANAPWFARALRSGGFAASEPLTGVVANRWVSMLTYPVAGENGTGLLVLALDLESLRAHARDLDPPAATNVAIVDREGTFLMNLREPQRVGRNFRAASAVSAVLGRTSGTGRFEGMDGVERFYSWSELPQTGWHVYAGTPVRELIAPIREFSLYGALVIVSALLLVVALARLIARRIVEPVEAIGAAARRIAAGDGTARAPLAGAPELVAVAAQFNAMIDRRLASEARFEQLVGIASDYVWELDAQFRFSFLSPSIEQRSAVPYREYLGKRFPELPFLRLPQAAWKALRDCLEAHEPLRNFELGLTNAAGEQRWFDVSADPLFSADGRFEGYRGVGHDITELRRKTRALERANTNLRLLSGANQILLQARDEARLLDDVCALAVREGRCVMAWVALCVEDERKSVRVAAHAGRGARYVRSLDPSWADETLGCGPTGTAIREGRTVTVTSLPPDPGYAPWRECAQACRFAACCALPLRVHGRVIGALTLCAEHTDAYGAPEIGLFEELAANLAFGIQSLRERIASAAGQAQLRATERRLAELMARSPVATYALTWAEGKFHPTYVSENITRLVGFSVAEVMQPGWWREQVHPEDRPRMDARQCVLLTTDLVTDEYRVRTRDGHTIWVRDEKRRIADAAGETLEIVGAWTDITEARRAEEALLASEQRYRGLSRRLLNVQEEERRALARELHDEFGQALTALKLNLSALRRECTDARAGALLQDSLDLTDQTIARIRARSLDLRPAMLDDLGLAATVQWYGRQQAMRSGIPVVASVGPLPERPEPGVETAAFRIVQEALTNALRHAQASRVDIRAWCEDGRVCVSVRDDGCGFDPQRLPAGSGSGLTGMAERVRALDGEIRVMSAPGRGTEVRACVPLHARGG